jgi:hypothetical protein
MIRPGMESWGKEEILAGSGMLNPLLLKTEWVATFVSKKGRWSGSFCPF